MMAQWLALRSHSKTFWGLNWLISPVWSLHVLLALLLVFDGFLPQSKDIYVGILTAGQLQTLNEL